VVCSLRWNGYVLRGSSIFPEADSESIGYWGKHGEQDDLFGGAVGGASEGWFSVCFRSLDKIEIGFKRFGFGLFG
jgi:hypothetical protein